MNRFQRGILGAALLLVVVMFLFPPFHVVRGDVVWNLGYGFLFNPPTRGLYTGSVNIGMLLTQWFGVIVVASIGALLVKD